MTETIINETFCQQIIEARVIAQRKEKARQKKANDIYLRVLNQIKE
jgi:hypothetical protein